MNTIDVFNGDADGICALHQLRLAMPAKSTLVTGVKRDISLLSKVYAERGDRIVVLDVSMDKNREDLLLLLDKGCHIHYVDHHFPGEMIEHPGLITMIDTVPGTCTSLLINRYLENRYPLWAAVGAYGDNLHESAQAVIRHLSLSDEQHELLSNLGLYLNYNGYGATLSDLVIAPDVLYLKLKPYDDPFKFIALEPVYKQLQQSYLSDIEKALTLKAEFEDEHTALYMLPDAAWARRVSGVFSNQLARNNPARAHAILVLLNDGGFQVSVRASLDTKEGADKLCCDFPSGGGRKMAAGINYLPKSNVELFIEKFRVVFSEQALLAIK